MDEPAASTIDQLIGQIGREMRDFGSLTHEIRVACPGLVRADGSVGPALHSAVAHCDLANLMTGALNTPARVVNDAHAQALGLDVQGACALFVSIGTSIGGAYLILDWPLRGANGFGGEVGHTPSSLASGKCRCGRDDCLDLVASGWSLERDLGSQWWMKPSPESAERVRRAGAAVADVDARLQPVLDHNVLVVGGHLVEHEAFREGLQQSAGREAGVWPLPRRVHLKDLDQLTWAGLTDESWILERT